MTEELWPFTQLILEELKSMGVSVPRVDMHDVGDLEGSDFLFGELTPHLQLSEGEYMEIGQEQELYCYTFGTRGSSGGDPTYGGENYFKPTPEKARELALIFVKEFKLV